MFGYNYHDYIINKYFYYRIKFSPACKVCELNHNGICFLPINCFNNTLDKAIKEWYTKYIERRQKPWKKESKK